MHDTLDTIIIGGGPAGLSAAKHLAYYQRQVLVLDRQTSPLNYLHNPIQNYLGTHAGLTGQVLLRQFQGEVRGLGASITPANVVRISGHFPQFRVQARLLNPRESEVVYQTRTILLATGVSIIHPQVNHRWEDWLPLASQPRVCYYCTDCEAPQMRNKSVMVIGVGSVNHTLQTAHSLQRFTPRLQLLQTTDGFVPLTETAASQLAQSQWPYNCDSIQAVKIIAPGIKQKIVLKQGIQLESNCFFVATVRQPRSELACELGVVTNARGAILTDEQGKTSVAGIWAAGDVRPIARQIAVAVGTGNYAALMINRALESLP